MSRQLPHYLKAYRKKSGFSQDEIAFLMGGRGTSKVSRYERFIREPNLRNAFMYQVIFGAPTSDLFAGIFTDVKHVTQERAKLLLQRLKHSTSDPLTKWKIEFLLRMLAKSKVTASKPL